MHKDKQMFKALSDSDLGRQLVDYIERLVNHTVDIRQIEKLNIEDIKGREVAANILEELKNNIVTAKHKVRKDVTDYS